MAPSGFKTCAGATVAARTLSGHGISTRVETSLVPDSTRTRFLTSRLVAQLLMFVFLNRARPRSEELVRHASGARSLASILRGGANQLRHTFPRLPGRIPVLASGGFFMPPCA
jgi:hypothetical protein